jgi:hypothetical protein
MKVEQTSYNSHERGYYTNAIYNSLRAIYEQNKGIIGLLKDK